MTAEPGYDWSRLFFPHETTPDADDWEEDAARPLPPGTVRMVDVVREPVEWLWEGRVPRGKLTVIDGDPGLGKSTLTMDLAARVSRGQPMPNGTRSLNGPAGVVILSAEDGLGDTVRPRLEAAGADLRRIVALTGVGEEQRLPGIPMDIDRLGAAITEADAALAIIDPLMAYLDGDVNAHRDQDVRRALAPLAALAEGTGVAIMLVRHLNKASGAPALYRGGGSIGISGAARSVLLVARDPDAAADELNPRTILSVVKSNLAATAMSMAYRLIDDPALGCAKVSWEGTTTHSASDLVAVHGKHKDHGARNDAEDFLAELLEDGPVAAKYAFEQAKDNGISAMTLRRAKKALGVVACKVGQPGEATQRWEWSLSEGHQLRRR